MTTVDRHTPHQHDSSSHTDTTSGRTRLSLACGATAGPLFAVLALGQAATRRGFDITKNPISQLSDGPLGWIQITAFVAYGALTTAGARGLAAKLSRTPGGRWAPRLVAIGGAAILVGGCFRLDPGNGFPAGAPQGQPKTMTWHSYAHLAGGGIGFICLIAACFVLAHHYARTTDTKFAWAARVSGAVFIAGDVWSMSGATAGPLTLCIGVLVGMLFISATAFTLRKGQPSPYGRRRSARR